MNTASRTPSNTQLTQASVLVVDDEENFLYLTALALSREGYHVVTAGNGVHVLANADREKFPLAILDIHMEPMMGIEVLAELKKRDPTTQVVIVTGDETEETRKECARLGVGAYLEKPVEMSELKAVLRDLSGAGQLLQSKEPIHEKKVDDRRRLLCPSCDSHNVRPSHLYNLMERAASSIFISPYRCLDCEYRFWKIN